MKNAYLLLLLLNIVFSYAQQCNCSKSVYLDSKKDVPDSTFIINGKKIMLCGYKEKVKGETFFSEFVLEFCDQNREIGFWSAMQTCKVYVENDTLKVIEIKNLPTGQNRTFKETEWLLEKIYFTNQTLNHSFFYYPKLKKYSKEEIAKTIAEYKSANGKMDEYKMEIANRLFIAILSGSEKAKTCFNNFKSKFGQLDGAFSEEYNELESMLFFVIL